MTRARLHPLPPRFPAPWAVAYGEDRHGLWEAFELAGVRQVLRWIPPGQFLMGSPEDEPGHRDDERQHPVTLTQGFWLADTACTQALWLAVMGPDARNPSRFDDDAQNPVEQVSWEDVVTAFLPRTEALLPGLGLRLPSEAEWEYACRADAPTSQPFSFGPQIHSEQVNFDGTVPMAGGKKSAYRQRTVPVKALPCNAWGLYQMHGNVWEWCQDWRKPYPAGEAVDPVVSKAEGAAERVLRGGSWFNVARHCRSAVRYGTEPGGRGGNIGFRLARGA